MTLSQPAQDLLTDVAKPAHWQTATALALLLGVGSGTGLALLGLVNGMLASETPGQILEVFHSKMDSRRAGTFTYAEIERLNGAKDLFTEAAAYSPVPLTLKNGNSQGSVNGSFVTDGYFAVIHSRFVVGQSMSCDGHTPATSCFQTVLSQQFWRDRFASDPSIIGRPISIDDHDFIVRGVVASESAQVEIDRDPQAWISIRAEPDLLGFDWLDRTSNVRWLLPIVRMRTGITLAGANSGIMDLLNKGALETNDDKEFLLLTPGQARVARTLRVRGELVAGFGSQIIPGFWFGLSLWSAGLSLIAVRRSRRHLPLVTLVASSLAAIPIAAAVSLIAIRILVSFLRAFGVSSVSQRSSVDSRHLVFLFAIFLSSSLLAYACQKVWEKSALSHNLDSAGSFAQSHSGIIDTATACWTAAKEHRYVVLGGVLIALVAGFTYNGIYGTDFWHHAAVVRELATHPFHPQNPILRLPAPHEGFSPYGLLAAGISRVTGLSAVDALIVMGFVNLLLLLFSLRAFVRAAFPAKHTDFYALLLMLVLWGFNPWMLSGFLHLNYLIRGTAYPSTFAIALTFLAWYIAVLTAKGRTAWLLLFLILIATTVFLVHPMTAGSMTIGCAALTFSFARSRWLAMFRVGAACVVGFLLALAWPYYPFYSLIFGGSHYPNATNAYLYPGTTTLISMVFLAFPGLPLLYARFKSNHRDCAVIMFSCFTLIYICGGLADKFLLGRAMFFAVFMVQLALADWLARNNARSEMGLLFGGGTWFRRLIFVLAGAGCLMMLPGFVSSVPIFQNSYGDYAFLPRTVGQYDIVLSDFSTSLKIPAIAAKVVSLAPDQVMIFVDHTSAENDALRFFAEATTEQRIEILRRHGVSFVLLNKYKSGNWPSVLQSLTGVASITYADGDMLLLRVTKV
jgi:MacB-like periplasmic core domain